MAVNLARFLEIHPEHALEKSILKFSQRFQTMEEMAVGEGRSLQDMGIDEMERYWVEAKKREKEEKDLLSDLVKGGGKPAFEFEV